jgi:hypothetical protein
MLDLAPAIDRHERALSQEIAANDADEGQEARGSSSPLRDADAIPTRRGDGGDSEGDDSLGQAVVAVAGLGPVHFKVSAAGVGGRRGELAALHAALSDPIRPADGLAGVVAEDRGDDPVLVALVGPASSDGAHRPTPDYLTSACILALGMGLVTGPVIPDLLRLIPSRSSRWRTIRRGGSALNPGPATRERGFGTWFRRKLSSRE